MKNIASLHLYNVEQGLLSVNYLIYQVQGLTQHQVVIVHLVKIFHNSMHYFQVQGLILLVLVKEKMKKVHYFMVTHLLSVSQG